MPTDGPAVMSTGADEYRRGADQTSGRPGVRMTGDDSRADEATRDREALLQELRQFSTPAVLNGLKRLGLKPAQMQTTDRRLVRCMAPELGARTGIAVTRTVATHRDERPTDAARARQLSQEFDVLTASVPGPKFLVAENAGDWQGPVCIWGEVAASINLATGFVAGLTNGPVRDVSEMRALGFQTFAAGADVGGGFVDIVGSGADVTVGGITVATGDLMHGDEHGVVKIPWELAPRLPEAIRAHEAVERAVIAVCQSKEFSLEALATAWASGGSH
jgi:regulator of RNase E activity RraA